MAEAELPTMTQLASPVKSNHKRTRSMHHGEMAKLGLVKPMAKPDDEDDGVFVPGTDDKSLAVWQSLQTFGKDNHHKVVVADGRVMVKRRLDLALAKAKEQEASAGKTLVKPRER